MHIIFASADSVGHVIRFEHVPPALESVADVVHRKIRAFILHLVVMIMTFARPMALYYYIQKLIVAVAWQAADAEGLDNNGVLALCKRNSKNSKSMPGIIFISPTLVLSSVQNCGFSRLSGFIYCMSTPSRSVAIGGSLCSRMRRRTSTLFSRTGAEYNAAVKNNVHAAHIVRAGAR